MGKDMYVQVHMDEKIHYKLKYICIYEKRTMTKQMLQLLKRYILEFETQYGEIQYK